MELLLNILWLALAVPAVWIWRRKPAQASSPRRFVHWRPYVLLGCALILLFPVVSATDDLHAMRPEMEESNASKRVLKQAGGAKTSAWTHPTGAFLSESVAVPVGRDDQLRGLVCVPSTPSPELATFNQKDSRAPPATSL
ncbi:MAG TPA: hypothetical protein VEF05_03690 [Terriglobales bacterium]|nr:hypothetical protein [Terriglobales bacterium]